jgi:hypothetical protein
MISRNEQAKPLAPPATSPVKPERAETPCVIGVGVTVTGKITSPGFVQIDGHVQGEVRANTLVKNYRKREESRRDIACDCSCGRNDFSQAPGGRHGRRFRRAVLSLGEPNG